VAERARVEFLQEFATCAPGRCFTPRQPALTPPDIRTNLHFSSQYQMVDTYLYVLTKLRQSSGAAVRENGRSGKDVNTSQKTDLKSPKFSTKS
ncbi:hypothetical protein KJE08_24765, partial [Escherichia marmotae]|uniref:hypothetical protein n=1 Tax=Escherichia marmotae TaxID=1499973 RepID=UPI002813EB1E